MIPYAVSDGLITKSEILTFQRVVSFVGTIGDCWKELTCHGVCEKIIKNFPTLRHVRGKFNGWDHSWLEFPESRTIIDAYPWACGSGPILIDTRTGSPWATLYCGEMEGSL